MGGYAVLDLSYRYQGRRWSVMASANNVFDRNTTDTGIYKSTYTVPYQLTLYPNPGRTLSLVARYLLD
jgi:outer membrane receptor protein involved in Fe transport